MELIYGPTSLQEEERFWEGSKMFSLWLLAQYNMVFEVPISATDMEHHWVQSERGHHYLNWLPGPDFGILVKALK